MTSRPSSVEEADWPSSICLCRDKLIGIGGAERVYIEMAHAIVRRGIKCTLVLFESRPEFLEQLPPEAEIIVLGDTPRGDLIFIFKLLKLARVVRRTKADLVIANQSLADYLRIALTGTGIPYILLKYTSLFYLADDTLKYSILHRRGFQRVRNSLRAYREGVPEHWSPNLKHRMISAFYAVRDWLGTRGAKAVFTLTSQSKWELEQLYGINPVVWTPGSSQVHRPPRNEAYIAELKAKYGIKEGERVVLSVNRLEYRKRIGLALAGFHLLSQHDPTAKMVIVGIGEEQSSLERQAREAGIEDRVIFAGLVSEESLIQHYYMTDVAIAVVWGSWTLTVVEPLLYNKVQVITDEIPDLLEGMPNLVRVKPEPEDVAKGLEAALAATPQNSYDVVLDQLDWDKQMDKLFADIKHG